MSFTLDLKKFAEKHGKAADEMVAGVEIALGNAVIMDTPVDEGRLIANWFPSEGVPSQQSTQEADKTGALSTSRINGYANSQTGGRKTYLTNNLPYAVPIEFGHSKIKAPQGMVRKNVGRFQALVDEQVAKHKL